MKNLIKFALNRVGLDLVKASRKIKLPEECINYPEIISAQEANNALKSVGRTPGQFFTYFPRPQKSTLDIDNLENRWWNKFGNVIEDIWGMPEDINILYRANYVSRAKNFFLEGNKQIKVLDLGCGTGWFGRMIADENIDYIGIDFSSTQINIANHLAKEAGKDSNLKYYCLSDFKKIPNLELVDGIIINAFLHHLYWDELNELFTDIKKNFKSGCKIFIMEPVYPDYKDSSISSTTKIVAKALTESVRHLISENKNRCLDSSIYNLTLSNQVSSMFAESKRNGFFLSPKEVPFKLHEIYYFLSQFSHVECKYYVGVMDIEIAQFLAHITHPEIRIEFSRGLYPLVKAVDEYLLSSGFLTGSDSNYLFTCFHCTLK